MKKAIIIIVFCLIVLTFLEANLFAVEEDLGTIVVTSTRIGQHDYEITGDVTVLGKEQIEAFNQQNVPDLLKEALGVHVYDSSTTKSSMVDIRGFGDTAGRNVLVLINDRKINPVDVSGPDLVNLPIESIEKIEIIRGAGSVLYGDNAVGGVINIITKKGKGNLSGQIGSSYGSYDSRGTDMELSGEYKNISYYLYSQYMDQRGYRSNSDMLAKDYNTQLGYKLTDKIILSLDFGWHEDDQGLPGGLNAAELKSLGRKGSADEGDYSSTKDRYIDMGFDITPWPEDLYLGKILLDYYYRNRDTYALFQSWDFGTKRNIDTHGIIAKYIFDRTIFNRKVNFVTGLDLYEHENDILGSGSNTDNLKISKAELGGYGYLEYELFDRFFINAGNRYQQAEYTFDEKDGTDDIKRKPSEWVSMGGSKYEYAKGSNIFFNVQQTFRFLATDEWYSSWSGLNTDLLQQKGIQYEAGVKHNFDDAFISNVTPYWIDIKDEIFYDPEEGFFGSNSNYDKTRRIGVEIGEEIDVLRFVNSSLLDKWKFILNYAYENPQFNGGPNDNKDIPMVPRHQTTQGLLFQFMENYNISVLGKYVGSRYAINDTLNNTPKEKPYYVLDGKISYQLKDFETFAEINNILNKKYSPLATKAVGSTVKDYFPAPERNFRIGMKIKF